MNKNIYKCFLLIPFILALTLTSCGDDDSDNSGSPTGGPVIYMWVSTTTTTGNIGGYDGANKICEQDAAGITFPTGMAFHKALLSGPGQDARNLFDSDLPVKRPDNTEIIGRYADFFDQSKTIENSVGTNPTNYWTGVSDYGVPDTPACNDWSNHDDFSFMGQESATTYSRLRYSTGVQCSIENTLLCLSN